MYRSPANTEKTYETLHRVDVRTARGRGAFAWFVALGIMFIIFGAAGVMASVGEKPVDGAQYVYGVSIPASIVLVTLAVWIHKRRRRTLRIVRADDGREHRLLVDGSTIDLELPLVVSLSQRIGYAGNVEQYHVYLHLTGAKGGEVLFHELRGKLQGRVTDGLTDEAPPSIALKELEFDVAVDLASDLRRRVQRFNELLTKPRDG